MTVAEEHTPENARVWVHATDEAVTTAPFLAGTICAYSCVSPAKDSPNEDAVAVIPFDAESGLLVVADGLGGMRGGDQASAITVYELCASLEQAAKSGRPLREAVLDGIENANREVSALAIGAASTVAVAELRADVLRPYHVGDSEVLVVGGRGKVKLQTVSHSPMGYAVESGLIGEREALAHEDRHFVFNVVGIPEMRIEMGGAITLAPRDTILVACDGLVDNLTSEEIATVLAGNDLENAVSLLVSEARERMTNPHTGKPHKPDDLSVVAWRRDGGR